MKVCLDLSPLLTTSRFRGHGSYALGLARALARDPAVWDGLEIYVMAGSGPTLAIEELSEATLARLGQPRGMVLPDPLYYGLKRSVGLAQLTGHGIDLYHSTDPKGTPHPPRCRVVATCHDLIPVVLGYPFQPPVLPVSARAWVERRRYRAMDHVIAISQCTRRDLLQVAGIDAHRVDVIYHGVDRETFQPEPEPRERVEITALLGSDRPYLLYVGGFDRRKNVPQMVEAFGRRLSEMDEQLLICGDLEPTERAAIEERIRQTGSEHRVVLAGFVAANRLPALYRQATAHVMLSSYEGFGMTITEAFACGCPVIALRASCVPEIAGEAALLVDEPTAPSAGEAMVRAARDAELRARLRACGLERSRYFTWERCASQTVQVYRSVLETCRS